MALTFSVLTILVIAFIVLQYTVFLFGNGEFKYDLSPYVYTVFLTFPCFAYAYAVNTNLLIGKQKKVKWFQITLIIFYFFVSSFYISCLNGSLWWLVKLLPNYEIVKTEFPELFGQAFKTICLAIPFAYLFNLLDFNLYTLRDDNISDGIEKFIGMTVSKKKDKSLEMFACDAIICKDVHTLENVLVPEKKRMEATLVQGATGTGKTAMVLLPMSSRDIQKKFFIREYSKKVAISLLKRGIAYIQGPFTNEYINLNFSLNYIFPKKGKESEFYSELKNVILYQNESTKETIYKNLGITIVENDGNYVNDFINVAKNFDMEVLSIDPSDPNHTLSMNPFAIKDASKVASIIADVLKSMQQNEGGKEETFFAQVTSDAFQNLAILLKEMYPRLNNGKMPNLEDMLELLYNFDGVESMVEDMKKIPELAEKYKLLIAYFEKNFYKPSLNINGYEIPGTRGSGRKDTERFLYGAITQLNNLLRHPGIKKSLCGRDNVIDFDKALEEGALITACSRKGELGVIGSKAFGMFFILQFQDAILRRPGTENTRLPHFLYIDEFPEYMNKDTEVMFTLFRKYRCGVIVAIQNLSQLEKNKGFEYYRQVVLANTKTQIVFGDTVPEDSAYWNKAFGIEKKVDVSTSYDPSSGDVKASRKIEIKDKERFKVQKIAEHPFGFVYFKTKKANGNTLFGEGEVDFLEATFKEKHPAYMYNFEKYMINKPVGTTSSSSDDDYDDSYILNDEDDLISMINSSSSSNENYDDPNFKLDSIEDLKKYDNTSSIEDSINSSNDPILSNPDKNKDGYDDDNESIVSGPITKPVSIKDFNLLNDDDFDIVIDTGSDGPINEDKDGNGILDNNEKKPSKTKKKNSESNN